MKQFPFENVIWGDQRSSLEKVPCEGCGEMVCRRDLDEFGYGLCTDCYTEFCQDMAVKYGEESLSDSENYFWAHSL